MLNPEEMNDHRRVAPSYPLRTEKIAALHGLLGRVAQELAELELLRKENSELQTALMDAREALARNDMEWGKKLLDASEDTERVDWLENSNSICREEGSDIVNSRRWKGKYWPTMREAIDAARAALEKTNG